MLCVIGGTSSYEGFEQCGLSELNIQAGYISERTLDAVAARSNCDFLCEYFFVSLILYLPKLLRDGPDCTCS